MAKAPTKSAETKSAPSDPRVVVFHGPERFLITHHTDALKAALIKQHGQVDVIHFDGATAKPADILDECRSMGLMMQPKLVIVDNADQLLREDDEDGEDAPAEPKARARFAAKSPRELFESYAASPEPTATLVLRADTWRPGNLDKAITAAGGVVNKCEEVSESQASAWAVKHAKSLGCSLDQSTADTLVELLGAELGRIASEIDKLSIAAGKGKPITAEHVRQLVGASREEDAWSIQSVLLSGNCAACLQNLHTRLDTSRLSPVLVTLAYVDLARKIDGAARGLAAKEPPQSMRARLKLWGSSEQAILSAAQKLGPRRSATLLARAIDADKRQKSGGGDPIHILEGLTLTFSKAFSLPAVRA